MDLGLQGARVLVTGASAGLGRATARQFSREGAIVVINSRNLTALQTTATEINTETGNLVYTIAGDVSVTSEAEKVVRSASEMMGGLDVIVTNAGGPPAGTFDNFSVDDWRSATDLTFITHVALIKAALPYLRQSSRPAILTITSSAVKQPVDNLTLSNAIRPAVIGLTKTLSLELGAEGIRVNSILPGMTDTDRVDFLMKSRAEKNNTTPDEERQKAAQSIPLKRIGTPQEFANAAVFLCSPAAGFITGVSLPVDGGTIRATM
ncbi:MAG: 3-oxoacyl-ACP reductase [Phototrophicales bacterium]|nr:MAG: 3-oxoacyl-ACP reductase [Phototrophicales bacterium]